MTTRADIVDAIRQYQYYRESFGNETLAELESPDVVASIDAADELTSTVMRTLDIKAFEVNA